MSSEVSHKRQILCDSIHMRFLGGRLKKERLEVAKGFNKGSRLKTQEKSPFLAYVKSWVPSVALPK